MTIAPETLAYLERYRFEHPHTTVSAANAALVRAGAIAMWKDVEKKLQKLAPHDPNDRHAANLGPKLPNGPEVWVLHHANGNQSPTVVWRERERDRRKEEGYRRTNDWVGWPTIEYWLREGEDAYLRKISEESAQPQRMISDRDEADVRRELEARESQKYALTPEQEAAMAEFLAPFMDDTPNP